MSSFHDLESFYRAQDQREAETMERSERDVIGARAGALVCLISAALMCVALAVIGKAAWLWWVAL